MAKNKKLELNIIGQTNICNDIVFDKNSALEVAGSAASICYDEKANTDMAKYLSEDSEAKIKRGNSMVKVGHGSPLEHFSISFVIKNMSKIQSLLLNNQRVYSLTERSFRYTRPDDMPFLYKKWLKILEKQNIPKKKAQETARYMISMFDRNSTAYYTMNIRQINVVLRMLEDFLSADDFLYDNEAVFESLVHAEALELYDTLKLFDMGLQKSRYQKLLFYKSEYPDDKIFDENYVATSTATPVSIAQLQRHRTISYSFSLNEKKGKMYYIPPFLNKELSIEWYNDAKSVYYPNCMLFELKESGTILDFMMKYDLRKGENVQAETRSNVSYIRNKLMSYAKNNEVCKKVKYALFTPTESFDISKYLSFHE